MQITLKNIREFNRLMIKRGFTKNGLSKVTNIAQPTISQISNGIRKPSPVTAKKIACALEVEFDEIFTIMENS